MAAVSHNSTPSASMNLIAVGATHKTASIEQREQLAFSEDEAKKLLSELIDGGLLSEAMLVSTCNRTELYAVPALPEVNADYLKEFLIERKHARKDVRREHLFSLMACGAAKHLFEVVSGVDSMILGESQISGQVKNAYRIAVESKATGALLNKLSHAAFSVSKRVKSETKLSDGAISVSYAAVELARKIFSDLSSKQILLVGAGETAELAAIHLRDKGARRIFITNRTAERAEKLSRQILMKETGGVIAFESFKTRLHDFDIIICAVSDAGELISAADLDAAMRQRKHNTLLLLDLGVPRNIDAKAAALYNVFLKDVDDLKLIIDKNVELRRAELPKVQAIVNEELIAFEQWHNTLQVAPTIRELQAKFEDIKKLELERIRHKVSPEQFALMEQLADRILGKVLHLPISALKSPVDTAQTLISKLNLVRSIFELGDEEK